MASSPRYGCNVTASASRCPKIASAYFSADGPMSPRLASITTTGPDGTDCADSLEGGPARGPERLEVGRVELDGQHGTADRFHEAAGEGFEALDVRGQPVWQAIGSRIHPKAQRSPDLGAPPPEPLQNRRGIGHSPAADRDGKDATPSGNR